MIQPLKSVKSKAQYTDRKKKNRTESNFKFYSVLKKHEKGRSVFNVQQDTLIPFTPTTTLSEIPDLVFEALKSASLFIHPTSIYLAPTFWEVQFFAMKTQ